MKIHVFGHKQVPSRTGGVEVVVTELSARMVALGHEVICYNRQGPRRGAYRGIKLKKVPAWNRRGMDAVTSSFFASVATAFASGKVCHIHGEGPALMCFLPKLFGKRVIVTVHGLDWQREKWKGGPGAAYIRLGEKMAVRFADEIIVLSQDTWKYFHTCYKRDTHYIPNGITRPEIRPPREITAKFGLEKEGYLLFLGRLVPEKGVDDLIGAFGKVKTSKHLVIAGASSDTDAYAAALQAMAAGDERILFTGFVEGTLLEELLSNAYLYVLPSHLEGMPMSLLEAMSYGNCCLLSDIPACRETARDRAVYFPAGDREALANCLQKLCDGEELVKRYREGISDYVCSKYDWDEITRKTLELYR